MRSSTIVAWSSSSMCATEGPSRTCPATHAPKIPARVGAQGAEPLPVGELPLPVRGLIQAVKTYEQLTIEAALGGDVGLALQALVANPLVGSYTRARPFLDRVLANERESLPRFHSGRLAPISGGLP